MSTLSDFFGGNNKIGINGSGKQVYYAMCSYNTTQGTGGFVFFDEDFRLASVQSDPGNYNNAVTIPHNVYMASNAMQSFSQVFHSVQSTATQSSSNTTASFLNSVNASGECGNATISVYSDGTYENAYHMSGQQHNKHYLNAYAINSDHLNKRNVYILNSGSIKAIDRLNANYNYPKIGTSAYNVTSLNTSMQGAASYNRSRKEMVILSYASTGGNFNVITFQNLDLDIYEDPSVAFARPEVVRVDSTVALTSSWSVNNSESYYNLKPVLCDNGDVIVSVMFASSAQRAYRFIRSGTSDVTGTLLDSNTLTTSYGLDQGFQYGQRQITSRDGTAVAVFCPYYYYGTGNATFMINKTSATYTKYLSTDTGNGIQVLPYKSDGWVFVYSGNGYAGNYTGNYIQATYLKATSGFTQIGSTRYFPAHTYPNTTNYPGFTQVVDYSLLIQNIRGFK